MKFGMLAAAAVLVASFFVLEAPAQETIKSTGTVVTSSDYRTVQPSRRGLFSRLRNRNSSSSSSTMSMAPATVVPASATTTTPIVTTTAPMMAQAESRQGLLSRLRGRIGR